MKNRILAIDDNAANLYATKSLLEEWNYEVDTALSGHEGLEILKVSDKDYSVILLDYQMPEMNGAQTAAKLREINCHSVVLIYSCDPSRDAVKETFRLGVCDFIDKNEDLETLRKAIELACQKYENEIKIHQPIVNKIQNVELLKSVGMIGHSQKLADVVNKCLSYRNYPQPVLILGETGSGKELVAKAIHGNNLHTFFAVNCAAFAEGNLIESELFGYEKSAFTGADQRKLGLLETAGRGTVFLDELHHLSLRAQGTLLRAIREKKIRRVGSSVETPISCRILAAAKPELKKQVLNGSFLADLFYRLKFLTVDVPALRDRPEDIGLLVEHFCHQFAKENGRKISFRAKTIHIMEQYGWPGNIGELEGCVSQLLVHAVDPIVSPDDLDERFKLIEILENPKATLSDLEAKHRNETRNLISDAIQYTGSKRKAAQRLGINESSLRSILGRLRG